MPSRRRPDRIFTVPTLCSAFGQDILGNAEMGGVTPPAVLSRRCSFQSCTPSKHLEDKLVF